MYPRTLGQGHGGAPHFNFLIILVYAMIVWKPCCGSAVQYASLDITPYLQCIYNGGGYIFIWVVGYTSPPAFSTIAKQTRTRQNTWT